MNWAKALQYLVTFGFLKGFRAYAGGFALVTLGSTGVICNIAGCDTHGMDLSQSLAKIAEGLGILGIRAKFGS